MHLLIFLCSRDSPLLILYYEGRAPQMNIWVPKGTSRYYLGSILVLSGYLAADLERTVHSAKVLISQ